LPNQKVLLKILSMKYKSVPLEDIKKYIYMKLEASSNPTSICRVYEILSGNTVSHKTPDEGKNLLNVIINNPNEVL